MVIVIMHYVFNNIGGEYGIGKKLLVSHTSERDFGVIVQSII